MARNQRIFYACQAVCIMGRGKTPTAAGVVKGLQSVGMSSTFTLDQVFEMGQIEIYENIEEVADIEVTLEKAIDGNKLIYDLASSGKCKTDVVASTKERSDVYVAIFDDGLSHATGVPRSVCFNSGMFTSSVAYNYSIDGTATESVTLVGNERFWNDIAVKRGANNAPESITPTGNWRFNEGNLARSNITAVFDGNHSVKFFILDEAVVTVIQIDFIKFRSTKSNDVPFYIFFKIIYLVCQDRTF